MLCKALIIEKWKVKVVSALQWLASPFDISNKQLVEMKHILPKSGANLVQFSGRSECPLLKWSHMQDSIDGLESLFFFLHVKKLFTKLKHPRDPKHWMCGDKFALTVPLSTQVAFVQSSKSLCRVQPRFLPAFAFEKEVRKVRMRKKILLPICNLVNVSASK